MRFKQFLLEAFTSKAEHILYKQYSENEIELRFLEGEQMYGVLFNKIPTNNMQIPEELEILRNKVILNVAFGDIDENDQMNFNADKIIKKNSSLKVISKVYNIVMDSVKLMKPSIIIFSAKKQDTIYSSRVSLYNTIISMSKKGTNFSYISFEDSKGTYFVLYDRKLNLSKKQINSLYNQMSDDKNFLHKILFTIKKRS